MTPQVQPGSPDRADSQPAMPEGLRAALLQSSTATLATLLWQRGLRNQFVQGVQRLSRRPLMLVGPAFTLRTIPAREDIDVPEVFRDPAHPQRLAMERVPPGSVLVMDCRGDVRSGSAGGILLKRLEVRGCAGLVTDGALRDADAIAELAMPVFCGGRSAPANLTRHHAVEFEVPIGCGDAPVYPGDILVGDGDGVVVIPRHLAPEIAEQAVEKERLESFVLEEIAAGAPLPGTYPPNEATLARYRDWSKGRR